MTIALRIPQGLAALALLLTGTPEGVTPGKPAPTAAVSPAGCQAPCTQPLFSVRRSTNANELVYEGHLTGSGFDLEAPLGVSWVMHARGGGREHLTNMERKRAYGISLLTVDPREARFEITAVPSGVFRVEAVSGDDGQHARAYARVNGEEMAVERIFIAMKARTLFPKVLSITFSGTSVATHEPVERSVNAKGVGLPTH